MEIDKLTVEKILNDFKEKSREFEGDKTRELKDKISFLTSLRALTVDLTLHRYISILDERELSVLYLVRNLVNDVFTDLATDASFGFEEVLGEAGEFAVNLGRFIHCVLNEAGKRDEKALKALFEAIKNYHQALVKVEEEAEQIYEKRM